MKNVFEIVADLLKKETKYISEDGKFLKAVVYSDVMTMDEKLLNLLLSNERVKETFFKDIKGTLVFDKQKFAWFIESKEFLPDSYTRYTNKIGLTRNGEFISKINDVVLDFPYKDCYLQGGQDKDEQKRKEIFYNEIIASDEINRLLSSKVFTKSKRYHGGGGVELDIKFKEEDNLIIKGNNLIALSSILKRYEGKVKCIYIDPPYNTGNDSFNYNDNFNHSTWLTFMKNRLELAKRLLRDDGVIFVHLDDKETHYCKVVMDSIFGRDNFISLVPRITGAGATANRADYVLRKPYDFILMYANDKLKIKFKKINKGNKVYDHEDKYGKFMLGAFQDTGSDSFRKNRPNLYYLIYVLNDGTLSLDKVEGSIEILPNQIKGKDGRWMWKKEKFI
ncbi:site-specific DNA-methyltransferase [Campylobacter sp. FMV-PI01]|uniref:site-specific DNA-methyltransferase (adenine-specific) n=1 Tax=Campylobacter portucalensis TaxID=2608384 RepID=A0A6L5WGL9_9BACT|nr:site-specific DNA-methyltransferase [Campylobacter portucalensis]